MLLCYASSAPSFARSTALMYWQVASWPFHVISLHHWALVHCYYRPKSIRRSGKHKSVFIIRLANNRWRWTMRIRTAKVPMSFIYGQTDWMDPKGKSKICQRLRAMKRWDLQNLISLSGFVQQRSHDDDSASVLCALCNVFGNNYCRGSHMIPERWQKPYDWG